MTKPAAPGPNQMPAAWSAAAAGYAEFVGSWREFAAEAARQARLRPADVVLDVAAGPGTLALVVAPSVARVVATDFSPGMLQELEARAGRAGVRNVETAVMDAQDLKLEDASFAAAFCMFGFMFFPDRPKAFRELLRVLKPGGRGVVATWAPIERRPLMKIGMDAFAEAMPQVPPMAKGDLQTVEECRAEMSAAGFRDVEVHPFTASYRFESAASYTDATTRAAAPLVMLREKLGEPAWAEIEKRVLAIVERKIPAGGATLSAEALITVGVR
ncbi:MAG TPA: methyltransferase domain-containing protein [Polyangiaceae bacterium]|nr:methyltransferase domain-containing protein [Polyangiaceae bacterium]